MDEGQNKMIKCSECGYENMDGLDYCDGCGAKLAAADAQAAPASEAPKAEAPAVAAPAPAEGAPAAAAPAAEEAKASEAPTGEIAPSAPEAPAEAAAPAPEAAAVAAFKARLKIVRGGRKDQEFELEDGNNLVGRWDPETEAFPEVDLDADDLSFRPDEFGGDRAIVTGAASQVQHSFTRLDGELVKHASPQAGLAIIDTARLVERD